MSRLDSKKSYLFPLAGLLSLAVALWVVLCGGMSAINQENIDQKLQQFSGYIAVALDKENKIGKFTYGDIQVEGLAFNKRVVVRNVGLAIADKSAPESQGWVLTTSRIEVLPDSMAGDALLFVFPEPVNIAVKSQPKTTVTFSAPLRYAYFDGKKGGTASVTHNFQLPGQITFTPVKTAEEPADNKNEPLVISYDENPVFRIKILPDKQERDATYEFRNIKFSGGGVQATIAALLSHLSEKPSENGQVQGKYTLMVSDLAVHDRAEATKGYSLNADLDYTGTDPVAVTLNQLLLVADDFKITAGGKALLANDDPLPSGNLFIDIDNIKQFLASDLVPEQMRAALAHALQKITGQPADILVQANIPVKREKNGGLYLGNVTFEEVAASMFADIMQSKSAPAPSVQSPAHPEQQGKLPEVTPPVVDVIPANPPASPAMSAQ